MTHPMITFRSVGTVAASALLFAACSSTSTIDDSTDRDVEGQVVEGGELGVFHLQEGDCVHLPNSDTTTPEGTEEVESLEAVPCADPHTGEIVLVDNDFYASEEEFPGDEEAFQSSIAACTEAIEDYTGEPFETSAFDIYTLVPTAQTWEVIDDRELACIGYTLDDSFTEILSTTGSFAAD